MKMIPLAISPFRQTATRHMRLWIAILSAIIFSAGYFGTIAWAANIHRVSQKDRSFNLKALTIATGDVVQFTNDDEFIHQVYVNSSGFKFDSAESEPGDVIKLQFTVPGTFVVLCHIHPKMMLMVTVQ